MHNPPLFLSVRRFVSHWRAWREEVRTEYLIDRLPAQIHRDIGWPDIKAARRKARHEGSSL